MQQTTNYKLNKPGMDDTFAVAPLNENADAIDAQLALLHAADTALDSRVQTLELHRFAAGSYPGTGGVITIQLGFTPAAVIVQHQAAKSASALAVTDHDSVDGSTRNSVVKIIEGGFQVLSTFNNTTINYYYIAIA